MQKLTFRSIGKVLSKRDRRKLLLLSVARIAANLLDLIGLAGVALLAMAFGALASGSQSIAPITLPLVGEVLISELEAVLIAALVALVFLAKSVFSIWLNLMTSLMVAELETRMSTELAKDYFSPISSNATHADSVSEFQNRVMNSTEAIGLFLKARMTFVAEASLLVAMTLLFLLVNPVATLALGLLMGVVLAVLNQLLGVRIARNGKTQMEGYKNALQASRDLFGVRREALAFGATSSWIDRFAKGRAEAARGSAVIYTLSSLPRYVVETSLILGIFTFIGGVVIVSDLGTQAITIGVFLAGGLRLVASLLPLQAAFNQMRDGANRGELAFSVLMSISSGVHSTSPAQGEPPEGSAVAFEHVSFRYPGAQDFVLRDLSFEVKPLTKVALVGPSGAGKSTVFELATGYLGPDSGSISLGGLNPREILLNSKGYIGIVPQRPHLVTGSIVENVSLVDYELTDKIKVKESLHRVGLSEFTESEDWQHLPIRPDSGQLSGGEIQRLGLARALYHNPKLLFLDEATSALDAETEAEITKVLQSLKNEMTVILIAHRLSTVQHADKIIYLDKGKIVAEGTFKELKAKVPDFAKAVDLMDLS